MLFRRGNFSPGLIWLLLWTGAAYGQDGQKLPPLVQDTLTSIRLGKPIAACGYDLAPNAEQHLRSRLRLTNLYPATALAETVRIAQLCTFSLDTLRYEYPDELVPPGETATTYLHKATWMGARWRFPNGVPAKVQKQLTHELTLIAEMRYESYFLTVYDIVRFARSQNILCQGRGSAANSAVCYCLGITNVSSRRNVTNHRISMSILSINGVRTSSSTSMKSTAACVPP